MTGPQSQSELLLQLVWCGHEQMSVREMVTGTTMMDLAGSESSSVFLPSLSHVYWYFSCMELRPYLLVGSYGHTSRVFCKFEARRCRGAMVVWIQCIWFNPLTGDHDECIASGSATSAYVLATVSASDLVAFL